MVDLNNSAVYPRLDEPATVESEEVRPGVILDNDAKEDIIGIETLGLKSVPIEILKNVQLETA